MTRTALVALALAFFISLTADAAPRRSAKQRADFVRLNPCPATGKTRGACPGWHVDHILPLKCGGADHPSNMQWLTVRQHKAKTKREARWCRW
jgi:5-methylcytosine-specific restriction endonuclease McrA